MKKIILTIFFLFIADVKLFAQQPTNKSMNAPVAKLLREVSGIVIDSTGASVPNVNLKLRSVKDSLITSTDNDGIFVFENVKMPVFSITITAVGFKPMVNKYFNNDAVNKIVLQTITLKDDTHQLSVVNVSGRPTIIYKTDTIEYRAKDYIVPAYATIDELLKKIEGMEVGADGSLTHNGQSVIKAKLNGKEFGGGNVAQAIQNLPASIVDKIQIVDDFGEQAARTGIKDSPPTKTLNITTAADKSIGSLATITSQEGNNGRYLEQFSGQNINANRVLNLVGGISNVVNGIASSSSLTTNGNTGSTRLNLPGTIQSASPTLSYSNTWNNNLSITVSYSYNFNNINSVSNNYGQINSTIGLSDFRNSTTSNSAEKNHIGKLELQYNFGKFDFLQINSTFNYDATSINRNTLANNFNYFTTGFEHPMVNLTSLSKNDGFNFSMTALYVHSFKNSRRNFSLQLGFTRSNSTINGDKVADYRYFKDTTQNLLVKDSLSHLTTFRLSNSKIYRSIITYVEPLNIRSKLEFTGQIRISVLDNDATADTVLANGLLQSLPRLDNIYNYAFTETRLTANYRYDSYRTSLSLGAAIVPTILSGNQVDNNTNDRVISSLNNFRFIPILRYSYSWSDVERFQLSYTGTTVEPSFQQIQPFIDRSDPNNILVGNPDLKPAFTHSITASYNKYFPNNKFNVSFNLNGTLYSQQVVTDIVQVTMPISTTINKTINEIYFVNVDGSKTINGSYAISKALSDRNYNIFFNGNIVYNLTNAVSNDLSYHTRIWDFNQRLGPRISLNDNKVLINPYFGYEMNISKSSTLNSAQSIIQTSKVAVDGNIYLPKNLMVHYFFGKNYLSGLTNYNLNPLVINAGFQKRLMYHNQSLAFTFDAFDLLHQNNFIQQTVTPQSTTYTLSNTLSRYFLIGLKLNLQHWGGKPMRNGEPLKRRGDGSFIN